MYINKHIYRLNHFVHCISIFCCFISVKLDISPPVVDCDTVKISFTSNGITKCQLNQGYFTDCTTPFFQSNLREGDYTFVITATDEHGQVKQDSVTFTITLGM